MKGGVMIYRHGDLLIKQIEKLPAGVKVKNTRIVAEGEATGHHHVLEGGTIYEKDGVMYLSVTEITPLTHEEHETIQISPGEYIIQTEKEYQPFDDEILKVRD